MLNDNSGMLSGHTANSGVAPSQMPLAAVLEEARLKRALGNEYRGSAAIFDEGNVIAASLLMHQEGMSAAQAAILAVWAAAHHGFLASTSSEHILDGEAASLQDTNDHFLANLQRNGTYSVVPRLPGGEVTPEGAPT